MISIKASNNLEENVNAFKKKMRSNTERESEVKNETKSKGELKSSYLYVICLCCHFWPVRAYRRFLTLTLDVPPIWSGTPHLGCLIHLHEQDGATCDTNP